VDWTRLAQDRVHWLAFVNAVMNIRVLEIANDGFLTLELVILVTAVDVLRSSRWFLQISFPFFDADPVSWRTTYCFAVMTLEDSVHVRRVVIQNHGNK